MNTTIRNLISMITGHSYIVYVDKKGDACWGFGVENGTVLTPMGDALEKMLSEKISLVKFDMSENVVYVRTRESQK